MWLHPYANQVQEAEKLKRAAQPLLEDLAMGKLLIRISSDECVQRLVRNIRMQGSSPLTYVALECPAMDCMAEVACPLQPIQTSQV